MLLVKLMKQLIVVHNNVLFQLSNNLFALFMQIYLL